MEELDVPGIAGLLGVSRPRVWQLRKQPGFPDPSGTDKNGRDYWYEHTILRWAAGNGRLADKAPLLFRPIEPGPAAEYFGVQVVRGDAVLSWDTRLGRVCVHYPGPGRTLDRGPSPESLYADAVVTVRWHEDVDGPELVARDAARPDRTYEPRWRDLARIFGAPVPWWPVDLRRPVDIAQWKPGARPSVIQPIPDVEITPLLQLAAAEPDDSSVHAALTHLARSIMARADAHVRLDAAETDQWRDRDAIAIAGVPTPAIEEPDELPEDLRRSGWLQVLERTDMLAAQCVEVALQNDGGRDFPYSSLKELDPHEGGLLAAEFAARLEPCERTAAFAIFAADQLSEPLFDPETGLPVAKGYGGKLRATVPQRLPAAAPLAAVTLDHGGTVWIRTADGKLWIAPEQSGTGLAWGYSGGGPHALAILLGLLLDDVTAAAPRGYRYRTAPGLLAGTTGKWHDGTTLTRADLEAARQAD